MFENLERVMKVSVNTQVCVAAGQCVAAAPAVFDQSLEDGSVMLIKEIVDPSEEKAVRTAANICPSGAIRILED